MQYNIRNIINADSDDLYCSLDFVYDRLYSVGVMDVKNEDYQNALLTYKYTYFGNRYGVVGVNLDDNEKDLISKVMNMYLEYFKDYKLELGYLIGNGEYTFFVDDTTIGRGM